MTSIEQQQPPASPAFNYHNRFANANAQQARSDASHLSPSSSGAALADNGGDERTPAAAAAAASDDFGFSFEDVKPLDFDRSYNQPASASASVPVPASATATAPAPAPPALDASDDVAALEAAVERDEEEKKDNHSQPTAPSGPPPLPPSLLQDPHEDDGAAQPRSSSGSHSYAPGQGSWNTTASGDRNSTGASTSLRTSIDQQQQQKQQQQSTAMSPSGSGRSLSQAPAHLQNFSRPQQQSPVPTAEMGALDLGNDSADAHAPQYRTVHAQQPVVTAVDHPFPRVESSAHPESFRSVSVASSAPQPVPADSRERPNSFFGMDRPLAAVNASGQAVPVSSESFGAGPTTDDSGSNFFQGAAQSDGASAAGTGTRPSSFFGVNPDQLPGGSGASTAGPSQAERIAAYHRAENQRQGSTHSVHTTGQTRSTLAGGTGNAYIQQTTNGRPASIAPSTSGPLLDHSHLKPGQQAALLSHNKTLELYRQNAKKTNDPDLIYELAVFMVDASKSMPEGPSGAPGGSSKDDIVKEAIGLLKKIAERGHPDAQYFLADCYANGIGSPKNKHDFDRAYPLFVLAAKHGHPDSAYRAGTCCEKGWGCRRDSSKALQFYRKASSQSHPGSMYRLATAELNGELGLKRSAKEGVKWLKRSAENATPEFPHALHELALLHERGIDNVLFVDPEYSCELLAQAGEMGYAPSAYKLGVNYEFGRMGCPQDAGLSIHMYNIAAQQNHKEACFALTSWYLVGAPGILPQSDTEAYLWAKKAAEQNLAKAEYAVGYFTEMGIGTVKDLKESKAWYTRAAEHGDKRANQRLAALGAKTVPQLTGVGAGANGKDGKGQPKAGQHGENALGTDYASMPQARRTQPTNAPFPSRVEVSTMSPAAAATSYPSPLAMRDVQSAQREERYLANVAAHQQAQLRAASINSASQPTSPISPLSGPVNSTSFGALHGYGRGQGGAAGPPMGGSQARPPPQQQQQQQQPPQRTFTPPVRPGSASRNSPGPQRPAWPTSPQMGNAQPGGFSSAANYPSYPATASAGPPQPGQAAPGPHLHAGMNGNGFQPHSGPPQFRPGGSPSGPSPQLGNSPPANGGQMTAMPLRLQSDDAAANQIAQRLAQQQAQSQAQSQAQAQAQSPTSADQPKKKKGWFK